MVNKFKQSPFVKHELLQVFILLKITLGYNESFKEEMFNFVGLVMICYFFIN